DKWEILADVLIDMYLNPTFDPEEVEKEREVIREELAMYLDQPSQHVLELLNEVLWPDHPLGRCITGTESSIDQLKAADLKRFWKRHYVSSNTVIVLAGPLDHPTVVKKLRKYTRLIKEGESPRWKPIKEKQQEPKSHIRQKQSEQVQLAFGIKACSRHDKHRYALRLLNTMLGENMSSRLFQLLREDHGLAYTVYSNLGFFHDTGFLTVAAGIDASHLEKAMQLIHQTLLEFRSKKPPRRELNQARDYLVGQLDLHLESTENHMIWLGEQILGFGAPFPATSIHDRLMAVSADDIKQAANEFFKPNHLNLAIVGKVAKKRIHGLQNWLG
ncbi:MAG: insulinase family protein, partial [Verrucomicrobia bacterium]|nr:insulinase family protein [Verrucomicrobiota bacterium]